MLGFILQLNLSASLTERSAEDLLAEYLQRWSRDLLYEQTMTVVAQI